MRKMTEKKVVYAALGISALLFAVPSASFAASCLEAPAKMGDADMQSFKDDPASLLMQNSGGGLPLSNDIRQIAASDSEALAKIIELTQNASSEQNAAIGAGLARAVQACSENQPDYANEIQQEVASLNNSDLLIAFASANTQIQTAALAGNGGTTSVGGGTTGDTSSQTGGTNNFSAGDTQTQANNSFAFSSGTSGQFVSSPTN